MVTRQQLTRGFAGLAGAALLAVGGWVAAGAASSATGPLVDRSGNCYGDPVGAICGPSVVWRGVTP